MQITHVCLSFVSIHQMSPPQLRQQTSNCSLLLIYRPRKDERLSWPGWLTYSGRSTHISGYPVEYHCTAALCITQNVYLRSPNYMPTLFLASTSCPSLLKRRVSAANMHSARYKTWVFASLLSHMSHVRPCSCVSGCQSQYSVATPTGDPSALTI